MSDLVLDCSVTMAWHLEENPPVYADAVLRHLQANRAFVPALWPLEVANVLLTSEHRAKLKEEETARVLSLLGGLPISIDEETSRRALGPILSIARRQRLTAYDAAYLELAMRLRLPLATLDARLRKAAGASGVAVWA